MAEGGGGTGQADGRAGGDLGPRVLRSSRLKTTLILLVAAVGVVAGALAVGAGEKNGWFILGGCAVLTLFACLLLLRPQHLELDEG